MAQKTKRTTDKWKKKKWFEIISPAIFDRKKVAETVAEKPETLNGRVLQISLRDLLGDMKRQYFTVLLQVDNVQGLKANTKAVGHEVKHSYLNRLIRRNNSKMETVQDVTTKDGVLARVKTIAISQRKIPQKKRTAIRKIMSEHVAKISSEKDFDKLLQEFVSGSIATSIFSDAKKVALLKRVEVTKSRIRSK
jgi:small subunit ribosomal protein S3Ae